MVRTLSLLFCLVLLASCTVFSPPVRQGPPVSLDQTYVATKDGAADGAADNATEVTAEGAADRWWTAFQSPELDGLVGEALGANFDLRQAWSRLRQAEAAAIKAGASLYPSVDLEAGSTYNRSFQQAKSRSHHVLSETENYKAGLAAAYELDLWGRVSAETVAAEAEAAASGQDVRAAAVTVAASVVENWIHILAVRAEMAILEQQIKVNQSLLDVQYLRFSNAMSTALDVLQQREVLAASRAEMPLLLVQERQYLNALALLLGRADASGVEVGEPDLPDPPPVPEAGVPIRLLAARPDVVAARMRLEEADWSVSAARADQLPSLNLSASAALSSGVLDNLLTNWINQLVLGLAMPLFDAGERAAEVDRTQAVVQERLAAYGQTVAQAVMEVEDALVAEAGQREYLGLLEEQLAAARAAYAEARERYLQGQDDYLPLLTELLNVQSLERRLVGERAALNIDRITLYRVLGGDWTRNLNPEGLPAVDAEDGGGSDPDAQG